MLVGNKEDIAKNIAARFHLRESHPPLIKRTEGLAMAQKIGAFAYLECSAMLNDGVKDVLDTALRAIFQSSKKKNKLCYVHY